MLPERSSGHLCTFYVGHLYVGILVEHVRELLRPQRLTRVPLGPASMSGLINVRGEIVPALDLGSCLGVSTCSGASTNVIVFAGDEVVSLQVDRIGEVVEVDAALFERTPANYGRGREFVVGAHKLAETLLLELDVTRLLESIHS